MRHSYLTTETEASDLVAKKRAQGWNAYYVRNAAGCWEVRFWR